ncbi:hypothetical protein HY522_00255 [bacterium]|nr:hypothetical protein [bacterium]
MNETLFLIGVSLSVGFFAVKAGVGAAAGKFGPKELTALAGLYLAVFVAAAVAGRAMETRHVQSWVYPLLQNGVSLHILMALGMGVWGWSLLRTRSSEGGLKKGAAWLVVTPCPVCVSSLLLSVMMAAFVSALSPVRLAGLLGIVFFVLSGLVYLGSSRLRLGADSLGLVCLLVSAYFLLSLAVAPAYAKASEIYALSELLNSGSRVSGWELIRVAAPAAALFGLGLWAGFRKHRRASAG